MKRFLVSVALFLASLTGYAQFTVPTTQGSNNFTGPNSFVLGQLTLGTIEQDCPSSPSQEFMTGLTTTLEPVCLAPPSQGTLAALCSGSVEWVSGTSIPSPGSSEQTQTCTGLRTGVGGDNILADFSGDVTGVVGFVPSTAGTLTVYKFPGSGSVGFYLVNNTGATIVLTSNVYINYIGRDV